MRLYLMTKDDRKKAAEQAGGIVQLIWAVSEGDIRCVKEMIKRGVDINERGPAGDTPLHWAVGQLNVEICELLINMGADTQALDKKKRTPLARARIHEGWTGNGVETKYKKLIEVWDTLIARRQLQQDTKPISDGESLRLKITRDGRRL